MCLSVVPFSTPPPPLQVSTLVKDKAVLGGSFPFVPWTS
jgi:hypothetical protein